MFVNIKMNENKRKYISMAERGIIMPKNKEIRDSLKLSGVKQWELAERLGITEFTLSRKLRNELSLEEKCKFLNTIDTIGKEKNNA